MHPPQRLRVALIEDSPLLAGQLLRLLRHQPGLQVVGQAASEEAALALLDTAQPDALLLDLMLAGGSGLGLLQRLQQRPAAPLVFVLSQVEEPQLQQRCLQLGARGVYPKSEGVARCMAALREQAQQQAGSAT